MNKRIFEIHQSICPLFNDYFVDVQKFIESKKKTYTLQFKCPIYLRNIFLPDKIKEIIKNDVI